MSVEAVVAVSNELGKLLEKKDAKGMAELYVEDARFLPSDIPAIEGRAAIAQAMQGFIDGGFETLKLTPVKTEIIGDTAIHQASYKATGTTPDGQSFTEAGKTVEIFKKQADGSWKFSVDIFNRDAPAGA